MTTLQRLRISPKLAFLGQLILYPKEKKILLLNIPTDAYYASKSKPIKELEINAADKFHKLTGLRNIYYIHVQASQALRLFNSLGGLKFFNMHSFSLKNSQYQYPPGEHYYSGEQILEYILLSEMSQPKQKL